jgi:hypothetical protein
LQRYGKDLEVIDVFAQEALRRLGTKERRGATSIC